MEKEFDLSMCRIIVDNAEQSKKLQELAFKQGFKWFGNGETVTYTHARVLYFNSETSRITFSDLGDDDSRFNTFHFTDVFKETLQEKEQRLLKKEQRLLKELEDVRKEMEEENKPKTDDICKFWDNDESIFIIGKLEYVVESDDYPYLVLGIGFKNCMKITDSTLLENLNRLFKN